MKKNVLSFSVTLLLFCFLITSCDDDTESTTEQDVVSTEDGEVSSTEVVTQSEQEDTESAVNEINGIVGDNFGVDTGTNKSADIDDEGKATDCIDLTSEEDEDGNVVLTIDYGDGCELEDGDIISGRIIVTYNTQTEDEILIDYELEDLVYNDIIVTGSAEAVYDFENEDGNLVYTSTSEFDFAWPDGLTATDVTTYSTETIFEDGEDEDFFGFYTVVTGSGETSYSNGDLYTFEITTPLRSEFRCRYYVSGTVVFTENSETTTLDYGDGECDNLATETDSEGNETIIDLDEEKEEEDETGS